MTHLRSYDWGASRGDSVSGSKQGERGQRGCCKESLEFGKGFECLAEEPQLDFVGEEEFLNRKVT